MDAIAAMREPRRLVVIEANGIINFDFTGAQIFNVVSELRDRGIDALSRARIRTCAAPPNEGLATLGQDHVFRSVEDAIQDHKRRSASGEWSDEARRKRLNCAPCSPA
jgi:hypothetical protein